MGKRIQLDKVYWPQKVVVTKVPIVEFGLPALPSKTITRAELAKIYPDPAAELERRKAQTRERVRKFRAKTK